MCIRDSLKVAAAMFLSKPGAGEGEASSIAVSPLTKVTMVLLMILIVLAGVNPSLILRLFL